MTSPDPITGSGLRFETSYTQLPPVFFHLGAPTRALAPSVVILNTELARELGLRIDELPPETQAALLSGARMADGATPFSQAYAGHQFGGFTNLGDGRAHVLGEHVTPEGERVDVQLKGSGRTPFSRGGDGRATLGPMLREYLISEAMVGLGIPTTRSLAVVRTGDAVLREQRLPGAVLTRVASSHLRVGTFQFAAALGEPDKLQAMVAYAIERHVPEAADAPVPALALWDEVARRQAALIAAWMRVGFVHGVMNTDNMTICGETIDYGPCAFLDRYAAGKSFSSIDRGGRYAFGNQPHIARWNLARFAEALLPLIDPDPDRAVALAQQGIARFEDWMAEAWTDMMRDKLGLPGRQADDFGLASDLLALMEQASADYTDTFRALGGAIDLPEALTNHEGWSAWRASWDARCERAEGAAPSAESQARMRRANPAIIPRNHRVEEALEAAVERDDLEPCHRLLAALKSPYEEREELAPFQAPPPASFEGYRTFCGT